jgi:hypothetical protein
VRQAMSDLRARHWIHVRETGEDLPSVRDWVRVGIIRTRRLTRGRLLP